MLNDFLRDIQIGPANPLEVVANLLVALILSLITSYVYRYTHTGFSYSRAFNVTMISVTMTITMIMMVIGNYIALSLGLVGALSVIRFRSAIKDPKDIAYLFLCIAIGLACSTGNYMLSVLGTLIINGTLIALHWLRFGGQLTGDYCVTFCLERGGEAAESLVQKADEQNIGLEFRSFSQISETLGEYVYSVKLRDNTEEDVINFFATEIPGLTNLSVIAPESNLEV